MPPSGSSNYFHEMRSRSLRPLTVNEALPYSPLTSILPFDPGAIPLPSANFGQIWPGLLDLAKHEHLRTTGSRLDLLLAAKAHPWNTAGPTQRHIASLGSSMQYKFKASIKAASKSNPNASDGTEANKTLSPLASTFLEAIDGIHQPIKISTTKPQCFTSNSRGMPNNSPLILSSRQGIDHSSANLAGNGAPIKLGHSASSDTASMEPKVVVSSNSLSYHPDQYKSHEPPFLSSGISQRDQGHSATTDQRATSDSVLKALEKYIDDLLESESSLSVDGKDPPPANSLHWWHSESHLYIIAPVNQDKLDDLLVKTISTGRLQDVSPDSLSRIQKICDNVISAARSLGLKPQAEWQDDDLAAWTARLDLVISALRLSRIVLRIMVAAKRKKQLFSEEVLQRLVDLVSNTAHQVIILAAEARPNGPTAPTFRAFIKREEHKESLAQILRETDTVTSQLLDLLVQEPLSETSINKLESTGMDLLFFENATSDKESILDVQRFETIRRTAMNVIAGIFGCYSQQRNHLIFEVLQSLQKLPAARQHARHYRIASGPKLQLTTVLLMTFVQSSAGATNSEQNGLLSAIESKNDSDTSDSSAYDGEGSSDDSGSKSKNRTPSVTKATSSKMTLAKELSAVKSRHDLSLSHVQHIVNYLVDRALEPSKNGEAPHRHVLDMFVEDLGTVVSMPQWPTSELLLRGLAMKLIKKLDSPQAPVPAKGMALEILSSIGSVVLDIMTQAHQVIRSSEWEDLGMPDTILRRFKEHPFGQLNQEDLVNHSGPFRNVIDHLRSQTVDLQVPGATDFYLLQWMISALWGPNRPYRPLPEFEGSSKFLNLARDLYRALQSGSDVVMGNTSSIQCRLAHCIVLLNGGLYLTFRLILDVFINACKSDQITVRSRAFKGLNQMLERNASILDSKPQISALIVRCATDQSSSVRENALALLGQLFLAKTNSSLDKLNPIFNFTKDSSTNIRRRALRLLRDVFLDIVRSSSSWGKETIPSISNCLLQRVEDEDGPTADLACQILEELWLSPLEEKGQSGAPTSFSRVTFRKHVQLLCDLVDGKNNGSLLEKFVAFSESKAKNANINFILHRTTVAAAFDVFIDTQDLVKRRRILQVLITFASANARLLSQSQLELLLPTIAELSPKDDLVLFRRAVIIFRHVLPTLSSAHKEFLAKVHDALFKPLTKFAKAELNEVAACLWTINGVLQNPGPLVVAEISVLNSLHEIEKAKLGAKSMHDPVHFAPKEAGQAGRLLNLAGHLGYHCDFRAHESKFKDLEWHNGNSTAGIIASSIKPFAKENLPTSLRRIAIENLGLIFQAWPQIFNDVEIVTSFEQILAGRDLDLKKIVLACFRDFFASQDEHFASAPSSMEPERLAQGNLGGSMTATDKDGAAALIAHTLLLSFMRIALSSKDENALTATELVCSIARQGLIHPKECGPTLVALSTSSNTRIAELSRVQYAALHLQHESMFEREYMRAVKEVFAYQQRVDGNSLGYTEPLWRAKLQPMYDVMKSGKSRAQSKFLSNLCAKIDFDPSKLAHFQHLPDHPTFARFLIENIALFDYNRVEDLSQVISGVDTIFAGAGAGLANAIDHELLGVVLGPETGPPLTHPAPMGHLSSGPSPERLRQLVTGATILTMLWEARNFICRAYGLGEKDGKESRREARGRPPKDASRLPPRNNTISGKSFAEAIGRLAQSSEDYDTALQCCRAFSELIAFDKQRELVLDEDSDGVRLNTPGAAEDGEGSNILASGGSKRKMSITPGNTPNKKKRGRPPGRSDSKMLEDDSI